MHDVAAPPSVERLPWDSEFFGFPIARVSGIGADGRELGDAVAGCRAGGVLCAYFLCGVDRPGAIATAIRAGFRLVDVRVTLRTTLEPAAASQPANARDARSDDLPGLRRLARSSYRDSRFFMDGRFDATRVEDLFQRWVERDVESGVAAVVEREGRMAGFATARVDGSEGAIGLVGVSPEERGRGVGRDAVAGLLTRIAAKGATQARVVTQGRNVAALGLYERLGFRTASLEAWLHWWSDENPV